MTHQRKIIRHAVREALKQSDLITPIVAAGKVQASRVVRWLPRDLPAIAIWTAEEAVDEDSRTTAPRELTRNLQLVIESAMVVDSKEDLDDEVPAIDDDLDDLAEAIERTVHRDETFGGVTSDCILSGTVIDLFEEGSNIIASMRMTWDVKYYTMAPEPEDVQLDNFERANIKQTPHPSTDDTAPREDLVELPGPWTP